MPVSRQITTQENTLLFGEVLEELDCVSDKRNYKLYWTEYFGEAGARWFNHDSRIDVLQQRFEHKKHFRNHVWEELTAYVCHYDNYDKFNRLGFHDDYDEFGYHGEFDCAP